LISTVAPASSNFALRASASALESFSLDGLAACVHQVLGFLKAQAGRFASVEGEAKLLRKALLRAILSQCLPAQ
jgi:hypothetical protein